MNKNHTGSRTKTTEEIYTWELVLWKQAATSTRDQGVNRKLANKYDGLFKIVRVLEKGGYIAEYITGIRGYRSFRAIVAADALRRYSGVYEIDDCMSDRERALEFLKPALIEMNV